MKISSDWIFEANIINGTCSKCKKRDKVYRHYIGSDLFFAKYSRGFLMTRYVQFFPEDIDMLCITCHSSFHKLIRGKIFAFSSILTVYRKLNVPVTDKLLWSMRNQIVVLYYEYLNSKTRKVKKKFKRYHKEARYWKELNLQLEK